jgi:heterodisulfide reductase subunit A-like polyferredoxin
MGVYARLAAAGLPVVLAASDIDCTLVAVGGGIGGLRFADAAAQQLGKGSSVCVFESTQRLGGRVMDFEFPQVTRQQLHSHSTCCARRPAWSSASARGASTRPTPP